MNQQPDKFFREKLHGYEKPVPAGAWSRVSSNLNKKKDRVVWLRVAAAVVLLLTATLLILPLIRKNSTQPLADTKTTIENGTSPEIKAPEATQPPITEKETSQKAVPAQKEKTNRSETAQASKVKRQATKENAPVSGQRSEIPVSASAELKEEPEAIFPVEDTPLTQEGSVAVEAAEKKKNITIVFTAEEVNEKYLTKKADGQATAEDKEASGLRKLLDKAYDLKHNQDPLGSLRQKKDEILAMNFKNEKRTQND